MKKKAIFLDRDGVINFERGDYTWLLHDFVINDGLGSALKYFKSLGYYLIVISNQGGIAKGIYTADDFLLLHQALQSFLSHYEVQIDDYYFCPHYTELGQCLCRKPNSLMIERALARYDIDASHSYLIGDKVTDAAAAFAAGVNPIIIEPNTPLSEVVDRVK
ncbi:MAG: hypothetical protein RIQ89_825 [Bacteroidota bacterium]